MVAPESSDQESDIAEVEDSGDESESEGDAGSDLDDDRSEEIELVDDMGVLAKLRSAIAQINFRPVKLDILRKQVTLWQQATGQTVKELRLKRDCITRYGHIIFYHWLKNVCHKLSLYL